MTVNRCVALCCCSMGMKSLPYVKCGARAYWSPTASLLVAALPPHLLAFVLLIEPLLQRREVLQHCAGIHLALTGEGVQRVGPRLALAHFEHGIQLGAGGLVAVERAAIERAAESGLAAHGTEELELQNPRQEVTGIRHIRGNVIFCSGIEIGLAARHRRRNALVFFAHLPPRLVVVRRLDLAAEDFPAPLVDEQSEWQESNLVEPLA